METTQDEMKLQIGTEEAISLKPAMVEIVKAEIQEVGEKKAKKVVCQVKHPDNADVIHISSMKWESKGKLEISGLWLNKDSKGLIRKGSALAVFMNLLNAQTIEQLAGKKLTTIADEKGYLCFKGY